MNNHVNPTLIGAFVVSAISLLIFGILVFSSGQWFIDKQNYVIYFDESVNGLNIGAPVKLSGVQIGKVIDIKVRLYTKTNKVLTPVFIEIEPDKTVGISDLDQHLNAGQKLDLLIENGLRMQLQLNSLLTGQLYVEALVRPDTQVKLIGESTGVRELPAIKSSSAELQKFISEALAEIKQIPFKKLIEDVDKLVQSIELITGSDVIPATLNNLNQTLEHSSKLIQTLNTHTDPILSEVRQTVATVDSTMLQMQSTLSSIQSIVSPDSSLTHNLENTLNELSKAARSGRILLDYLERHPEALVQGKRPVGDQ